MKKSINKKDKNNKNRIMQHSAEELKGDTFFLPWNTITDTF